MSMRRILSTALSGAVLSLAMLGCASPPSPPSAESDYIARLKSKIKSKVVYTPPEEIRGYPVVVFRIRTSPSGEVTSVTPIRASAYLNFDRAVYKAIFDASPLPRRSDGTVAPIFTLDYFMRPSAPPPTASQK
jgi:TonB family protein